jgi:hypothetical protein
MLAVPDASSASVIIIIIIIICVLQTPFWHVPLGHTLPHEPQLPGSVWRLTQLPLQLVSGATHTIGSARHWFPWQLCPAPQEVQATPPSPQLAFDVPLTQEPLAAQHPPQFVGLHGATVSQVWLTQFDPAAHCWQRPPPLPQLMPVVPALQAPVAVQHPAKMVPRLQIVHSDPPNPQTEFPSKSGLALLTGTPEPFCTHSSSASGWKMSSLLMQQPLGHVPGVQIQRISPS